MSGFDFRTCPNCAGYGVRDNGRSCTTCGGKGTGRLRSTNGVIGSGEVIIEVATRKVVSSAEFTKGILAKTPPAT